MDYYIIPDEEALGQCAACKETINEMTEVFGLGAKLKPGVDLSEFESHCIEIDLLSEDKSVYMMVTVPGSEAKNDGKDGMFLVCSESCSAILKKILEKEITLGKMFDSVQDDI